MLLLLLVVAAAVTYLRLTSTFSYWAERKVKFVRPLPLVGTYASNFLARSSVTQLSVDTYRRFPRERVVGAFRAARPELLLRDPALARRLLAPAFRHFHARGLLPAPRHAEPLLRNVFFADGDLWRLLRQRMTPAFTSGKLKAMFPLIVERAERLQARALAAAAAGRALDARDLMARYTTDFIGAVGFGLDAGSLDDDDSEFRKLGARIFATGPRETLVRALKAIFPQTCRRLRYLGRVERSVVELVTGVMRRRGHRPSGRNDFIDLMLECRSRGPMRCRSLERFAADGSPEEVSMELTEELVAAQAFVFFGAGFETSSSASAHTLLLLARHPAQLARVQRDVDAALRRHGRLSLAAVRDMRYLRWAFLESLRLLPPLGYLVRQAASRYTFPELGLTIDPGVKVMIPVQALHNDPRYFEDPAEFRPERFHPDSFGEAQKLAYMPFGEGPRACIGSRLALMQSLAGLAALLAVLAVRPAGAAPALDPAANLVQAFKGGLPLLFEERPDAVARLPPQ